ncbi:MAG: type II toxin-antitoxin system VapC family toxin [Candidatus Electrothrix sp. AX5]|uniref:PIN domain nuclease, a component of toxin-antitoxin system (PIN domain) n=1 Tax=Candidatus Electrothrix aarhusensis TaxID=1859131 RepID=A0A444IX48_9BACT|nr:type II toxin-antitoxin system VapC family toxin [Candidatus Electrothrix sp. AX5]RWX45413.1 PIN domain nuclease, a component of toxin-antitoxin system (PIN domain) [Candidatus Electrothrix aarhusensis]
MKILFDTHAFIWWDSNISRLSPEALQLCQNQENIILLSTVSIWEMQIKHQLGKLKLNLPLNDIVEAQQKTNGIEILPVIPPHVFALDSLPLHHKDPFDRLLIAQANVEEAVLLSCDSAVQQYPVEVVW